MSRTLHLTLTKRWFDMILSGEKPEEYREIKPYWVSRLCCGFPSVYSAKDFDYVVFKNGYSKNARTMKLECNGITIGKPAFKWYGANTDKDVFVISLGRILETHNL